MRTLSELKTDIVQPSNSCRARGLLEFSACVVLLLNKEPMASLALPLDFPRVSGDSKAPVLLNLTGERPPEGFPLLDV